MHAELSTLYVENAISQHVLSHENFFPCMFIAYPCLHSVIKIRNSGNKVLFVTLAMLTITGNIGQGFDDHSLVSSYLVGRSSLKMQGVAENSCLIIGTEDPEDFDFLDESEIEKLRRVQKKLNHALKILGVKISTFNALYTKGKAVALRELLDTHLSKLLNPDPPIVIHPPKYLVKAKNAVEYNPNFKPADLPTIHEAYQFLLKNYVESCKNESQTQFLTLAQIKVNNERRLMKERNDERRKNSFATSSNNSTPNSSQASSRRNSQISVKVTTLESLIIV